MVVEEKCLVVVSKIQHSIAKKSIKKQIALINRDGSILLHLFRYLHLFLKNKIFDIREAITAFEEFLRAKTTKFFKNKIHQFLSSFENISFFFRLRKTAILFDAIYIYFLFALFENIH